MVIRNHSLGTALKNDENKPWFLIALSHWPTILISDCPNNCPKSPVIRDDPVHTRFRECRQRRQWRQLENKKEDDDASEIAIKTDEMVEILRN